ncbi:hypothetical protein ACYCUO_25820 [Paenibacillus sp. SEL2]
MLESRKPEARAFRKWISGEILPTIRKTGGSVANEKSIRFDCNNSQNRRSTLD